MRQKKLVVLIVALSVATVGAATMLNSRFSRRLSRYSRRLAILNRYKKTAVKTSPVPGGPTAEDLATIRKGLHERELQLCSQALADPAKYSESDVAQCRPFQAEIERTALAPKANLSCQLKLPLIQKGCEGELCGCRTGPTAIKDADLLQEPKMGARKVGAIRKGERAAEFDLWMRIEELGDATVVNSSYEIEKLGLRPGDHFSVLQYDGEGVWIVCLGNKQESLLESQPDSDGVVIQILREPKRTRWVRIKTQQGVIGYASDGTLEEVDCG